jgi:hypothetical protein
MNHLMMLSFGREIAELNVPRCFFTAGPCRLAMGSRLVTDYSVRFVFQQARHY